MSSGHYVEGVDDNGDVYVKEILQISIPKNYISEKSI